MAQLVTKTDLALLKTDLELFKRDLTIRLGGIVAVGVAFLSATKFFG